MFYKKKGYPEKEEIVLCTVKKILYHSVFVILDEYDRKEGMLHISEVSPGRIRNLRDYVREGKKIICKVISINREKGHIDLSLRRVNQGQKVGKNNEIKQEQKAENLLAFVGKKVDKDLNSMYKEFGYKVIDQYGDLYGGFLKIVLDPEIIDEFDLKKDFRDIMLKSILDKIKLPEYTVEGILELKSEESDGVELIRNILVEAQKGKIEISYVSAPKYTISVTASDYKTADGILKNAVEEISEKIKGKGFCEFTKVKT